MEGTKLSEAIKFSTCCRIPVWTSLRSPTRNLLDGEVPNWSNWRCKRTLWNYASTTGLIEPSNVQTSAEVKYLNHCDSCAQFKGDVYCSGGWSGRLGPVQTTGSTIEFSS